MSSKKFEYLSIGKKIDGTTYCSAVETLAENLIEDNEQDAVIVFPSKDGWASMRSSSYRMTTENAEAQLPLPIYKVNKVLIKPDNFSMGIRMQSEVATLFFSDFTNNKGEKIEYFDASHLILNVIEWNALPIAKDGVNLDGYYNYLLSTYKDNTLYWEEGNLTLPFLATTYKKGGVLLPDFMADITPTYERFLKTLLYENGEAYIAGQEPFTVSLKSAAKEENQITTDVREWQFRIEYVPLTSKTKIRARKNEILKQEYIQPFNQRAEINAASAFGKNMWLTAQKTGCREIAVIKNYTKLNDIPQIGALVKHNGKKYRLVANHYVQTNTVYIQVRHTLSENWSYRSKHVAVDQKYRNWSIPQDTLWRNLYWEDYLRVGTSLKESDNVNGGVALADILQGFYVDNTKDKTIDTFSWTANESLGNKDGGEVLGASLPCSTYGIAHSLIFSASFKDNLSAGMRAVKWDEDGEYVCEEAMYCKADGTLDIANVAFGQGCDVGASFEINDNMTIEQAITVTAYKEFQSVFYPSIIKKALGTPDEYVMTNVIQTPVFNKEFLIYKDPGEALKFTYQIHLIGEDDCFFGNKFAEHNPLIKTWDKKRIFKVWALKHYVREGADVLETVSGNKSYVQTLNEEYFGIVKLSTNTYDKDIYGEAYAVTLFEEISFELKKEGYKAWAITDENNNIYLACNNESVNILYFQLHHSLFNNGKHKNEEEGGNNGGENPDNPNNPDNPGYNPGDGTIPNGTILNENGELTTIEPGIVEGNIYVGSDVPIAENGFKDCVALTSVTFIVSGLPYIGDNAFEGCKSLQYIKFNCTYELFMDIYGKDIDENWLASLHDYVRIEFYGEGTTVESITKSELVNQ